MRHNLVIFLTTDLQPSRVEKTKNWTSQRWFATCYKNGSLGGSIPSLATLLDPYRSFAARRHANSPSPQTRTIQKLRKASEMIFSAGWSFFKYYNPEMPKHLPKKHLIPGSAWIWIAIFISAASNSIVSKLTTGWWFNLPILKADILGKSGFLVFHNTQLNTGLASIPRQNLV